MMDNKVHILDTGVVLQVSWDSTNLDGKGLRSWVNHMVLSYDVINLLQH
jgi:hypothetical protein